MPDTSTRGPAGEEGENFEELSEYRILAFFASPIPGKIALITHGYLVTSL
jgi:membrane protein DedA with SNARE-associated domain